MTGRQTPESLFRDLRDAQDQSLGDRTIIEQVQRALLEPTGRRQRSAPRFAIAAGLAATASMIAVAVWMFGRPATPLATGTGATPGSTVGDTLVARADSDLPLHFADGSTVTFQPGAIGQVRRHGGSGADIVIERGELDAHVIHGESTHWIVSAGRFRIRVTGTRFSASWLPDAEILTVDLHEGQVMVDGGVLGAGVTLRAGQRLAVDARSGIVRTLALAALTAPPPGTANDTHDSRPARASDWLAYAQRGDHTAALQRAQAIGFDRLCRELVARDLLTLGDAARYSGSARHARQAFSALVKRFPDDPLAADAVFSLGRLAFEAEDPGAAAHWFETYVTRWPTGSLADAAAQRLLEIRHAPAVSSPR